MASTNESVEEVSPFPTEARVILQGLVKAPDLNGKIGVVRSGLSGAGRHTVYIEELNKSVGLKPSNLRYEPVALESLSVKELNTILTYKNQQPEKASGLDKSDLQAKVSEFLVDDSEELLPELLAKAKASVNASIPTTTATQTAKAAEQLSSMSPDQLRQQARMMRTMDPATVRRMNPQLANMTDAQLKMAADQMEMMANNPSMMKMAAEQMKNVDPAQLQKMQAQMAPIGKPAATPAPATTPPPVAVPTANQAQQAASMMQNMTPEQLRQQAQMLKSMDPDTLRRTNPQLAHMSDAQIKMAATQFEMMASNPAMMKMAAEQMKNVSPEQLKAMSSGQIPGQPDMGGGDPTEMLANMDKGQLKQMLNTLKDNPDMMKQFAGMTGMSEEHLKQGVESFAGMDDSKMDAALKMLKTAQKAKGAWDKADKTVGGRLKMILFTTTVLVFGMMVWFFFFRTASSTATASSTLFDDQQYATPPDIEEDLDSEF